jgi:hypothetical protein
LKRVEGSDKKNIMKRVIAFTALVVTAVATLASAQSSGTTPSTKPLAEVAKAEEARRKSVRKPAKVYTNGSLKPDPMGTLPPPPSTTQPSGGATSGSAAAPAEEAPTPQGEAKDQKYWAGRMTAARSAVARSQIFADSLQSRINALRTDFVNRDVPVQRAKIEQDLNTSLAELERVQKEIVQQTKAIKDLEDEARRAGVPPGWLR